MKAFTALILASIMVSVSIVASPTFAYDEPSVGVKNGDWVEYTVKMTGQTSAPSKNMTWFRIEILDVEDTAFQATVTVRYVNETLRSAIWNLYFTEGQCGGWLIIRPNIDTGDTFFDAAKPGNVTIEGEEQKTVAGAIRTITHA